MFFINVKLRPSTLKYLAITTSITGALFIILARYVGNFAVRLFAIGAIVAFSYNLKANYRYSGKLKRIADTMSLIGAIIVLIFPKFLMVIMGITILYFSGESLFNMIKSEDYRDKMKILASIAGLIFSIFCIFFSNATLQFIVRLLGAVMMAISCIFFYQYISKSRKTDKAQDAEFKFKNNSDDEVIIDVKELTSDDEK
jgi:hypothetical protein